MSTDESKSKRIPRFRELYAVPAKNQALQHSLAQHLKTQQALRELQPPSPEQPTPPTKKPTPPTLQEFFRQASVIRAQQAQQQTEEKGDTTND